MNNSQYDKDCVTWSPSGDVIQIKYVLEAVKQGTCVVGIRSKKFAVLAAFKKRQNADFASYDNKHFMIDDHCGMAFAGLTADARVMADYMRMECLNHKYTYDSPMKIGRLVAGVGEKTQEATMGYKLRPFGVGLLTSCYDEESGAHIYENEPTGNYYEYVAMAIGARSQSAKTYLERHFETFDDLADKEAVIKHAIKAISVTTEQDVQVSVENVDVSIVGEGTPYHLMTAEELAPFIAEIDDAPVAMETEE